MVCLLVCKGTEEREAHSNKIGLQLRIFMSITDYHSWDTHTQHPFPAQLPQSHSTHHPTLSCVSAWYMLYRAYANNLVLTQKWRRSTPLCCCPKESRSRRLEGLLEVWLSGENREQFDVQYNGKSMRNAHLLKSRISLLRAGVVILGQITVRVRCTRSPLR